MALVATVKEWVDVTFVLENLRLKELMVVANNNYDYFSEFVGFLSEHGYQNVHEFVRDSDYEKAAHVLEAYFAREFREELYDGIGREYSSRKAKWYFIAWLFRDAAAQRLQPLLGSVEGNTRDERSAKLINEVRKFAAPLFDEPDSWEWPAIREVMLARLEGSRRALKGGLYDNIVRDVLVDIFKRNDLDLEVSTSEVRLHGESYDVQVRGGNGEILLPVKTRETMGGGHALLFTRDIYKAIDAAITEGYPCLPVIVAESWGGDLDALPCEHYVYIPTNPNQLDKVRLRLRRDLEALLPLFEELDKARLD